MTDYKTDGFFPEKWKDDRLKSYFTNRSVSIFKATSSADAALALTVTAGYSTVAAAAAADGDKHLAEAVCDGTETTMLISYRKNTDAGSFDIYLNGVKDNQATVDTYAAAGADATVSVTLSTAPRKGYNRIELRVNGKNAASTDYVLNIYRIMLY